MNSPNNNEQQLSSSNTSSQNITGARPKVPQQNTNSIDQSTKMKRSPKFSSFDSQASLAEFAAATENSVNKTSDSLSMTNLFHNNSNDLPIKFLLIFNTSNNQIYNII